MKTDSRSNFPTNFVISRATSREECSPRFLDNFLGKDNIVSLFSSLENKRYFRGQVAIKLGGCKRGKNKGTVTQKHGIFQYWVDLSKPISHINKNFKSQFIVLSLNSVDSLQMKHSICSSASATIRQIRRISSSHAPGPFLSCSPKETTHGRPSSAPIQSRQLDLLLPAAVSLLLFGLPRLYGCSHFSLPLSYTTETFSAPFPVQKWPFMLI